MKPPSAVTVLAGVRAQAGAKVQVLYEPGTDLSMARATAKMADAVVLVAGFNYKDEGEYIPIAHFPKDDWGGDRKFLGLKPSDQALVQAVTAANPKTVVILVGGGAITVEEWHAKAGAILMAFYPGEHREFQPRFQGMTHPITATT